MTDSTTDIDARVLAWARRIYENGQFCANVDDCARVCKLTPAQAEASLVRLEYRQELILLNRSGVWKPRP